jgi:hypothetical protein
MAKLKKKDKEKVEAYLDKYRDKLRRLRVLSGISTRQFLGTRPEGDPRLEFLTEMLMNQHLATVQFQVLLEAAIGRDSFTREEFLDLQEAKLNEQLASIEMDLCIDHWDESGRPVFDLPKYTERTKIWPK